jgi:type II secretory pathway component GspD/PulD (secretin)
MQNWIKKAVWVGWFFLGVLAAAQERDPFGSLLFEEPAASEAEASAGVDGRQLGVQTVMLKFLRAENLKDLVSGMLSPAGKVTIDAGTNSLLLCDLPEYLERIVSQVRQADRMPEQILIEVVIADVMLVDDTEIGVNWQHLLGGAEGRGTTSRQILLNTFDTSPAATAGMDLTFLNGDLTATLHALQEQRHVELLATPRIVVLSGQEAEIKTVEEIPYTETSDTSGGGTLTSTKFKEVGVTLTVKAVVTDERKIQMTIQPKQNVTSGTSVTNVPIVNTRQARTTLLVEDGQVIVMGGLRRKDTLVTTQKVPLLGNLPVLGVLFSSEKKERTNSELLIMLSPHLNSGFQPTAEQAEQFQTFRDKPMLRIVPEQTNLAPAYQPIDALLEWLRKQPVLESGENG